MDQNFECQNYWTRFNHINKAKLSIQNFQKINKAPKERNQKYEDHEMELVDKMQTCAHKRIYCCKAIL